MKNNDLRNNIDVYKFIDVNEVNQLVDNVARSRYKDVDYKAIGKLAQKILEMPPEKIKPTINFNYTYNISKEDVIKIVLDFFKSIDIDFYNKALTIINGDDNNVLINYYKVEKGDKNSYEYNKKNEARVNYDGDKKTITLPLFGNIKDVYNMVHELSHMFDMPDKINISRIMLADVNSECFERMLDCYFEEKEGIDEELKKDLQLIRKNSLCKTYFTSLEYIVKYSFFNYKNYKGVMELDNIKQVMTMFRLAPPSVVNYLRSNAQDMSYSARYILGGLASEEYLQMYRENPNESVEKLKRYMNLIKENKGLDALGTLGINFDTKAFEDENQRINSINKTTHLTLNQIGL